MYYSGPTHPGTVTATKLIRKMRGGAQTCLVLCDDGHHYVLKMAGNPQGPNVLANEMLGTSLAFASGLPVAVPAFVSVSEAFVRENPDLYFSTRYGNEAPLAGSYFGSRLLGQISGPDRPVEYLSSSESKRVSNRDVFLGMYLFDIWANHQDNRQAIFLRNNANAGLRAVFIDHGHLFGGPYWIFHERKYVARHMDVSVYSGLWSSRAVSSWIGIFQQRIPPNLSSIADQIPTDWYGGDLSSLISTLLTRLELLPRLIEIHSTPEGSPAAGTFSHDELRLQGSRVR